MTFEIAFKEKLGPDDLSILDEGIEKHNEKVLGKVMRGSLAFFAHDEHGKLAGGVIGYWSEFRWLYVDSLWVDETARGHGLGSRLIKLVEQAAIVRGCRHAYLNTMSFQAPGFYEKLGYIEFGRLENFPEGHSRLFLQKTFDSAQISGILEKM